MIKEGLEVMDTTASSLSMDNDIPLIVFSFTEQGNNIKRVILGEKLGLLLGGKIMSKEVLSKSKEKWKKQNKR